MLGVSIGFVDRATVEMLLGESNLGWALIARIIALVVILVGAVFLRKIGGAVLLGMIILGAGALASLAWSRSEEHTSELQSLMRISYAVFCLKKKKQPTHLIHTSDNYKTSD